MADHFEEHRRLLFTVAYEMLGSVTDADDVLQESWLRWSEVDASSVQHPRAYLVRLVTRQSLNRLRSLKRQRETYVGPWLPEPLATTGDIADDVELAESVSVAMLVVLETLTPLERAVFVLREVFGYDYAEIAVATDRSAESCRQLASRARRHVRARRPRVRPSDEAEVVERFLAASVTGDVQALLDVLSPDVVLLSDAGGKRRAARRPVVGADRVARFLVGIREDATDLDLTWTEVNGQPWLAITLGGELDSLVRAEVRDGRVSEVYFQRNPDKLRHLDDPRVLSR